jgi:hypothetical protein
MVLSRREGWGKRRRLEAVKYEEHIKSKHRVYNMRVRRKTRMLPGFSPARLLRTNFWAAF